ncbi:tyrosine-type recombinase/integrase [Streptomyces antnestii]|uniref:tyrosine-type recombinase/integrase n=1 Tax=Streptomyces antnestii TaxID=2494256 RepID=UPI0016740069|nr:tyrosine-type recombinase/integrase [Streptomyces sp. San01]
MAGSSTRHRPGPARLPPYPPHRRRPAAGSDPQRAGDVITPACLRAGIEDLFTGHSVRSGMATEARRAGKDPKAIAQITGHKPNSSVLHAYMQIVDQWDEKDNALIGIGL